jgi:hypothetical protein
VSNLLLPTIEYFRNFAFIFFLIKIKIKSLFSEGKNVRWQFILYVYNMNKSLIFSRFKYRIRWIAIRETGNVSYGEVLRDSVVC